VGWAAWINLPEFNKVVNVCCRAQHEGSCQHLARWARDELLNVEDFGTLLDPTSLSRSEGSQCNTYRPHSLSVASGLPSSGSHGPPRTSQCSHNDWTVNRGPIRRPRTSKASLREIFELNLGSSGQDRRNPVRLSLDRFYRQD
jgi:hypothetical protein